MKKRSRLNKEMKRESPIKKYHLSVFTTNLFALVLAIFFIRSYIQRGIPILPIFSLILSILAIFIVVIIFILRPSGKIKRIFPDKNLIILNISIALIMGLIFLSQIGLLGFILALLFAFLLSEVEHIIYEGVKR